MRKLQSWKQDKLVLDRIRSLTISERPRERQRQKSKSSTNWDRQRDRQRDGQIDRQRQSQRQRQKGLRILDGQRETLNDRQKKEKYKNNPETKRFKNIR